MHFFSDGLALLNRNMDDGDCSHTTVTAVRADLNAAIDSFFGERRESLGEGSRGGIPTKLRLEHLADAG